MSSWAWADALAEAMAAEARDTSDDGVPPSSEQPAAAGASTAMRLTAQIVRVRRPLIASPSSPRPGPGPSASTLGVVGDRGNRSGAVQAFGTRCSEEGSGESGR
ncbi:hypothetical protein GCM10009548_67690 [Streptomyces malaysiensis subsp. malaysiensis]